MNKCLQCEKEYEAKRSSSKFCCDNCRVKYHRKNPKKSIGKLELTVLYNSILELLERGKFSEKNIPAKEKDYQQTFSNYDSEEIEEEEITTFEDYKRLKFECENEDDWLTLSNRIRNDKHLTSRQIQFLLS